MVFDKLGVSCKIITLPRCLVVYYIFAVIKPENLNANYICKP